MKTPRNLAVVRSAAAPVLLADERRAAIPPHNTPFDGRDWDSNAATSRLSDDSDADKYRQVFAWVNSEGNPDSKSSYRFAHHFVGEDGQVGSASVLACERGIASLNSANNTIPDADRPGVYKHLASHLRDAGVYPPELKSLAPDTAVVRASWRAEDNDPLSEDPLMKVEFSRFGNWYEVDSVYEGRFLERVVPGAFTKTINERGGQVKVLFNHGMDNQIGDKVLGPIRMLEERETGAYAEVGMLDTSYNRDLIPGLRAKVYGSSFMFNVMDDVWEEAPERSTHNPDGIPQRTITAVRLLEFGPVTWPANPQASAGMRSDTDRYYDDLRSRSPEQYDLINTAFGEFRSNHATAMVTIMVEACTSEEDGAVDGDMGEDVPMTDADTSLNEAAPVTDTSDEARHVPGFQGINSETRRARLRLAGVIIE